MPPVPKVKTILLCQRVLVDKTAQDVSLIGVFDTVAAERFPFVLPRIAVYTQLLEARGDYEFAATLVDLREELPELGTSEPIHVSSEDPLRTIEVVVEVKGITIPHEGKYEFQVRANGQVIGQAAFEAKKKGGNP